MCEQSVFFLVLQSCLIADIVQHFVDAKLEFDAAYVYQDVNQAIQHVHYSGLVHRGILSDPKKYLVKNVCFFNLVLRIVCHLISVCENFFSLSRKIVRFFA